MVNLDKEAMAHVRQLCVDIGPRPTGSPGNRAAADYIKSVFRSAGLDVERQRFSCPDWDHEETVLATMAGSKHFDGMVERIRGEKHADVLRVDPWPASDHYTFYSHGVPCIALNSVGVANVNHLPADTTKWISPARLTELVSLVTHLVEALQDETPDWCRPAESDEESSIGLRQGG